MQIRAMVQGVSIGLAVGTVCYMLAGSSSKQKRRIRKSAGQAVRAVGSVMEGVSDMMH